MAKTSTNNIQNLDDDWGNDPDVNLPYSGEAVQTFIKSYLRNVTAAAYFDPTNYTMYFFASQEDRDSFINDTSQTTLPIFACPMSFSSTLYRVDITNNTGSTVINTATNAGTLNLSTTFMVQTKSITDPAWSDTQAGCFVTIYIDRGLTGNYVPLTERILYPAGSTVAMDVFSYLVNGTNRVKFQFEAEDGTVTQALVYTVNLAELYVELFDNYWYIPVIENDEASRTLGGFRIAGAGYKVLHIGIFNSDGTRAVAEDLTTNIGTTNIYANRPYYYQIASGNPILDLQTGVYTAKVFVSTTALESEPIEYQFMFVAAEDANTAKLVCVNNVADKIFNYSSANVCSYAVYNGTASRTNLTATFYQKYGGSVVNTETQPLVNIPTSSEQTLAYSVLWPDIQGDDYSVEFVLTLDTAHDGAEIPIDNSTVFPPTRDYDFYMLAANRNNSQSNKDKFVNLVNDSELQATWTEIDFANGVDGWTMDDNNRACLRVPAKTRVRLPYSAFNLLSGDNQTFEICYRIANVADYDENVITISPNPTDAGFKGIRIKPTNITVHSLADSSSDNDSKRGVSLCDDEAVHFALTISRNYEGNRNKNIVKGYVYDGCKNFMFDYSGSQDWAGFNGDLVIGSDYSDVFIYFIRHYPTALSDAQIQVNYINSLQTIQERERTDARFASVVDSGGTLVDYEAVKNNGFNYFVINMTKGDGVPSAANHWEKDTKGVSTIEMHYGEHPEWDWKIEGVETMGQGTTSMNYYRWNIRWRIDKSNSKDPDHAKKTLVSYVTNRTKVGNKYQYEWSTPSWSKTVYFDGGANGSDQNHPAVMRITAKINSASSMHSHKMGATRAYTELHDAIGLENEAQHDASPKPVVSVYQYPAFGFEYRNVDGVESYTFIGMFTIGPDKGDKPTFGFDTVKSSLISLEGTDHNQPVATFSVPYDAETGTGSVNYFYTQEGIAINNGNGTYQTGLEVGNCHGKEIDKEAGAADEEAVRAILITELKPAYDLVWHNSTLIFPIALNDPTWGGANAAAVLANINANVSAFQETQFAGDPRMNYGGMQFWIEGEYSLYWYDSTVGAYVAGDNLGLPTGSTLDEQNENYKAARRAAFMAQAENFWDIQDALYHFDFVLLFGATDNFAKNTYPYKMATLENGGRWKWRQDDLDTLFDIDNMGADTKPYFIEFMDANGTTPFFAGGRSLFWNLIYECYWTDYVSTVTGVPTRGGRTIGQNIIQAMTQLSGSNNPYDGFINYIKQRFWDNAQNYFPVSAYNIDGSFKYEDAWLTGRTEALPQGLGDHFSAERLWVKRRAIYMLSLFQYGAFGNYAATYLGRIEFRPESIDYAPTPVMWMYPALLTGAGGIYTGARTANGVTRQIVYTGQYGETTFYLEATNYMTGLGNWKTWRLASGYVSEIGVVGEKLINFVIGGESGVTTNIPGISFPNNKCLETIDARNASSIVSVSGLSNCPRLRTILLTGTSIQSIDIPIGSKVETITLPAHLTRIVLRGLKHLSTFSIDGYSDIQTVHIEDTDIDPFALLANAYDASDSLTYIRIIWDGIYVAQTHTEAYMLPSIADPRYKGLAADGITVLDKPFVEGTVDISSLTIHDTQRDKLDLDYEHEEDYGSSYKKALARYFNTQLYVIYDPTNIYITFEDSDMEALCIAQGWSSDGVGIKYSDAAAVVREMMENISTVANNTVSSFDEYKYFTGITTIGEFSFRNWTALTSIGISPVVKEIHDNVCNSAPLTRVNITDLAAWLKINFRFQTSNPLRIAHHLYLNGEEVTKLIVPESVDKIAERVCQGMTSLTELTVHNQFKQIGSYAFDGCTALARVNIESLENWIYANMGQYAYPFYGNNSGNTNIYLNGEIVRNVIIPAPQSKTELGAVFARCKDLESVIIPEGITRMEYTFFSCSKIRTLILPESVTNIDGFSELNALESLTIKGVVNTGANCFNSGLDNLTQLHITSLENYLNCQWGLYAGHPFMFGIANNKNTDLYLNGQPVTSVLYPSTKTSIEICAFCGAGSLVSVTIPSTITKIKSHAFYGCRSLTSVVIPSSVTEINERAFRKCFALQSINIPNGCILGTYVFDVCSSLESVKFDGIVSSNNSCFSACPAISQLHITSLEDYFACTFSGNYSHPFAYSSAQNKCLYINGQVITNLVIPTSITSWSNDRMFRGNTGIQSVTLHPNVTSIPNNAFRDCHSITSIDLSTGLTVIPNDAFHFCYALTSVNFGAITTIKDAAFWGCTELVSVDLPATVTSIGKDVFRDCSKFEVLTCRAVTPPTLGTGLFSGANRVTHIYVPAGSVEAYKSATNWSSYASKITAIQ